MAKDRAGIKSIENNATCQQIILEGDFRRTEDLSFFHNNTYRHADSF